MFLPFSSFLSCLDLSLSWVSYFSSFFHSLRRSQLIRLINDPWDLEVQMVPDPNASLVVVPPGPVLAVWGWVGEGCRVAVVPIWNWGWPCYFAQGVSKRPDSGLMFHLATHLSMSNGQLAEQDDFSYIATHSMGDKCTYSYSVFLKVTHHCWDTFDYRIQISI